MIKKGFTLFIVICIGLVVRNSLKMVNAMFGDHSSFQSGLADYEFAPPEASDINVYRQPNITGTFLCDFSIEEKDFVGFANENEWMVMEISNSVSIFLATSFNAKNPNDQRTVTQGLYYSKRKSNGGGITVAYDRVDHRGYIARSSR